MDRSYNSLYWPANEDRERETHKILEIRKLIEFIRIRVENRFKGRVAGDGPVSSL